jgi:hypothetical protein
MPEQIFTALTSNFNGGEISPRMEGRTDTAVYQIALAEMVNFAPSVEGPAVKVPGFRYIRAAAAASTWLSPFVMGRLQAYVIEWLEGKLRFFTNGGRIEADPDTPYEVTVPYAAAEAPFVSTQQSYDRLYLAHRAHALASLTRLTGSTFAWAALTLEGGPFGDPNSDQAQTIAFSASSGTVTGYANPAMAAARPFTALDIGALFMVETRDYAEIAAWMSGVKTPIGQLRRNTSGQVYLKIGGQLLNGNVEPSHTEGTVWDGDGQGQDANDKGPFGAQWQYVHDRFGIVRIDDVADAATITATVLRRLPDSAALANSYTGPIGYTPPGGTGVGGGTFPRFEIIDGEYVPVEPGDDAPTTPADGIGYNFPGTWRWAHAAISDAAGWPVAVLLAWGRLVVFTDFEIIGSVIGDYGGGRVNFSEYAQDGQATTDMAFRRRLSIANPVLWAREDRGNILVGTQDGEYLIGPINNAQAVSAENVQCVKQTKHGSEPVWPVDAGEETIFVQRGGRKLRQAAYSFERDRYRADNINIWSRHILKSGCTQLAFEQESEEMLWALRADGVLTMHPHAPEQEVKGFARRIHAAGPVLSIVAIPSEDGTLDELWALVTNSETGAKSIEQRAPWWVDGDPKETAFFVDSGVTLAPASANLTGLTWLAGRAVDVLMDGAVIRGLSVTDAGGLTLPKKPDLVTIGLKAGAYIKTLRPELRDPRGNTMQGKMQRLFKLGLRLLETLGIRADPLGKDQEDMIRRGMDLPMGEGPAFFSGDVRREVGGSYDRHGQYLLISDDPVPCTIVAAMPSLQVTE